MISSTLLLSCPRILFLGVLLIARWELQRHLGVLAVSLCSPAPAVSPHPEFPKSCSYSPGISDMTEGLAVGQLAQLRGAGAVVVTIWPKDMLPGSLCHHRGLLLSFLLMWHVLFSVFILPLVCHGNWVRCFISTFFLLPCHWIWSPGKYGLSPKDIIVSAKMSFFEPMEERKKRKAKRRVILS